MSKFYAKNKKLARKLIIGLSILLIIGLFLLLAILQMRMSLVAGKFPDMKKNYLSLEEVNSIYQTYYQHVDYKLFPVFLVNTLIKYEDPAFWDKDEPDIQPNITLFFNPNVVRTLWRYYISKNQSRDGIRMTARIALLIQNLQNMKMKTPDKEINEIDHIINIALLEQRPKEEVIEFYLNNIYFGDGIYGLPMAAQVKFNTSIERLSEDQQLQLLGYMKLGFGQLLKEDKETKEAVKFMVNNIKMHTAERE